MTKNRRKICFVSGKRGGFGAMLPTLQAIKQDPTLHLDIIVTDMHLTDEFGNTVNEVNKYFKNVTKVHMCLKSDSSEARALSLGLGLMGITQALERTKPDILMILGDRGETLMAAVAATQLNIPIFHVQGGEISGGVDEPVRHAITKLSHLHLVPDEQASLIVRHLGESDWRVHIVGFTQLDSILEARYHSADFIRERYMLDADRKLIIVLQHSVSTEPDNAYDQMRITMDALEEIGERSIVIYPCSDQGHNGIIRAINEKKDLPFISIFPNLDHLDFLGLCSVADVIIGNSSSGMNEAPHFNLPFINIGSRQIGRKKYANCIGISHDRHEIVNAIKMTLQDPEFRSVIAASEKPYGDAHACDKILKVIKSIDLNKDLLLKELDMAGIECSP